MFIVTEYAALINLSKDDNGQNFNTVVNYTY